MNREYYILDILRMLDENIIDAKDFDKETTITVEHGQYLKLKYCRLIE